MCVCVWVCVFVPGCACTYCASRSVCRWGFVFCAMCALCRGPHGPHASQLEAQSVEGVCCPSVGIQTAPKTTPWPFAPTCPLTKACCSAGPARDWQLHTTRLPDAGATAEEEWKDEEVEVTLAQVGGWRWEWGGLLLTVRWQNQQQSTVPAGSQITDAFQQSLC